LRPGQLYTVLGALDEYPPLEHLLVSLSDQEDIIGRDGENADTPSR